MHARCKSRSRPDAWPRIEQGEFFLPPAGCIASRFRVRLKSASSRLPNRSNEPSTRCHEGVSVVQCPTQLGRRFKATFKAILKKQDKNPHEDGAVALQLVEELYADEYSIWEEIKAFRDSLPDDAKTLQPADVVVLSELAEKVQEGKRRGAPLKACVNRLARASEQNMQLRKGDAAKLLENYQRCLVDDVQQRVCELRTKLAELKPDDEQRVFIITRSPYRILRVPCTLSEDETRAVRVLYLMFDRFAWRARLSNIETKAFGVAQDRFRLALASGMVLADNDVVITKNGVARCYLGRTVRNKLGWVSEISLMIEEVFETFYRPCCDLPDQDRFHVFSDWALPYAAYVVNFLNAARNTIFSIMNPLFESADLDAYELVSGHKFPSGMIAHGAVPDGPVVLKAEQLHEQHTQLRNLGVDHLRRPAA